MYPDTIPGTPTTDHDTQASRDAYLTARPPVDYAEWLQETYYGGCEPRQ